jgi:phenylalanyl-tRNA synthetase beta subunit
MSKERYCLRGEYEEIKERLSGLYYDLKVKAQSAYQRLFELSDIRVKTYPQDIEGLFMLINEIARIKGEIQALEERSEYLNRKLKEVR